MKFAHKLLLTAIPFLSLAACGGGDDLQDRVNVADPAVRFVHAARLAPNVTLYRAAAPQSDATDVAYRFASNYFDVKAESADWTVNTTVGGVTLGAVNLDVKRGSKYTIIALPTSAIESGVYVISDPYQKGLTTNNARLRVMNASFNAGTIDLYMNPVGTNISAPGVNPLIAATAFKTSGPLTADDSTGIAPGTYQLTITAAGSKTSMFRGQVTVTDNQDILLLTVPDTFLPGSIKTLEKIEGTAGTTDIPAS